jgi:hypothetical protein
MSLSTRDSTYDAGPRLLRDVWGLTAVAILIVILRIVAKCRIGKFGADDLLMAFALVSKPSTFLEFGCCETLSDVFHLYRELTLFPVHGSCRLNHDHPGDSTWLRSEGVCS